MSFLSVESPELLSIVFKQKTLVDTVSICEVSGSISAQALFPEGILCLSDCGKFPCYEPLEHNISSLAEPALLVIYIYMCDFLSSGCFLTAPQTHVSHSIPRAQCSAWDRNLRKRMFNCTSLREIKIHEGFI